MVAKNRLVSLVLLECRPKTETALRQRSLIPRKIDDLLYTRKNQRIIFPESVASDRILCRDQATGIAFGQT